MLWVMLILAVLLIILGFILLYRDIEFSGISCCTVGVIGAITSLLAIVIVIVNISYARAIPDKITILEEQNMKIEQNIDAVVSGYLSHESDTYNKLTPYDPDVFAAMYPQLASNETVKKQMELYISNNKQITEHKLKLCDISVYKWWLYFGK